MNSRVKKAVQRMAAQRFPSDELLPSRPPILEQVWKPAATGHTAKSAEATVAPRSPVFRRRTLLAAGLVAVTAAALAVPLLPRHAAYAATPPMLTYAPWEERTTARELLIDLASRARVQPLPRGSGHYHYVHTQGWYLQAAADTNNRVLRSGIAVVDREQWRAVDGSGRLRVTDGTPMAPNEIYPPGGLSSGFLADKDSRTALRDRLNHKDTPAGWFNAVSEIWRTQVVTPVLHSNLLAILAEQPGLTVRGSTTDRVGRNGIAISIEDQRGATERLILVFDPVTGALLDAEEIVLELSDLPVQPPATIGYTVWLTTGYATTVDQRP